MPQLDSTTFISQIFFTFLFFIFFYNQIITKILPFIYLFINSRNKKVCNAFFKVNNYSSLDIKADGFTVSKTFFMNNTCKIALNKNLIK